MPVCLCRVDVKMVHGYKLDVSNDDGGKIKISMIIREIEFSDFSLVEVKTTNECRPTPHCKKHGAMNKITAHDDGGGIWRCLSAHSYTLIKIGNSVSKKENDCACRAGCLEVRQ